jgi:hypothetical protein
MSIAVNTFAGRKAADPNAVTAALFGLDISLVITVNYFAHARAF